MVIFHSYVNVLLEGFPIPIIGMDDHSPPFLTMAHLMIVIGISPTTRRILVRTWGVDLQCIAILVERMMIGLV